MGTPADNKNLLARIDRIIGIADQVCQRAADGHGATWPNRGNAQLFRSSGLTLLVDLFGTDHHYYVDFHHTCAGSTFSAYEKARAIFTAVRHDVEDGYLERTTSLIAGDLFSDFLEMADHLLENTFRLPSAVVAGCALEAHLRRLCAKHGISVVTSKQKWKEASLLNEELRKAGAYGLGEQKQITAWQDVRNTAAHGDDVEAGVVRLMIAGIRHFMTQWPA